MGKTTTTANIGVALAELGHRVALVGADIGLRNLDLFLGLENRIVYHICDVLERKAALAQALICHKKFSNLYLLPAAQSRPSRVHERDMKKLVAELAVTHEFVIVDSPAGIDNGFHLAIAGAHHDGAGIHRDRPRVGHPSSRIGVGGVHDSF
ncbi:MAG: Septum site-determining protein MinD [Firmicutes bacterium]|nr:Septum site-determining protein MinD [Bacillota bacterium]